jgi:adenine-specific DNA methylase
MLREVQTFKTIIDERAPEELKEKIGKLGIIKTTVHTPPYMMHKFWARRPWRVFRELITRFTKHGGIILDPFAGGGVTLVEGLIVRRKVVAVDLNPLAVKIMRHEVAPLNTRLFREAVEKLSEVMEPLASDMYAVKCPNCGRKAVAIWTEYEASTDKPVAIHYECNICHSKGLKQPDVEDLPEPPQPPQFTRVEIPPGDKTGDLLKRGIKFFDQLFTKRNLYMVLKLKEEIEKLETYGEDVKSFLSLTLSSTLKWASKMSHLRGDVVEGWALHAYWIYPKYLEINVWRQFLNRAEVVLRGKEFTNKHIGSYAREAKVFDELVAGATYMILQADSRKLPLPDESIDAVITDPPYGDNVNYAELSDYFLWLFEDNAPKEEEIVVNRTRGFTIHHYERGLEEVFKECYRVLKPGGLLISTFNSKDALVVGAFIHSLRRAGFSFAGALPQPYLKAYETTFHALQVDSMPYDYIFFFYKGDHSNASTASIDAGDLWRFLMEELKTCKQAMCSEREYRMRVYPKLIEFFAQADGMSAVISASTALENVVNSNIKYFKEVRKKRIEDRKTNNKTGGEIG